MAELYNQISSFVLSSDDSLREVEITTDGPSVLIELHRRASTSSVLIFSTTIYSVDGRAFFYDLDKLIEEDLRPFTIPYADYSLSLDGAQVAAFTVLFCEDVMRDFDPSSSFLTSTLSSVVHEDSGILMRSYGATEPYIVHAAGEDANGDLASATFEYASPSKLLINFSVSSIAQKASELGVSKLSYFVICQGEREKMFFVRKHPFYLTFRFKNVFNAPEQIDVPGVVTAKSNFPRETVKCAGSLVEYDFSRERVFEMKTVPLNSEQFVEVSQLIASRSINLYAGEDLYKVLITDHKVEIDNDNSSLSTVTFTFRFADERILKLPGEYASLMPSNDRIFTNQYNRVFS